MAFSPGDEESTFSDINVTPMVDVMLVLLIIFMVASPMLKPGLDVALPQAETSTVSPSERMILTLRIDGSVFLGETRIPWSELKERVKAAVGVNPGPVYVRADQGLPYGKVVQAMDALKAAGVEKVGLVTEPVKPKAEL